jgi:hypothetical protein
MLLKSNTRVLPQLGEGTQPSMLTLFAVTLHGQRTKIALSSEEQVQLGSLIHDLLSRAIDQENMSCPTAPQSYRTTITGDLQPASSLSLAKYYLDSCLACQDAELVKKVVDKLMDMSNCEAAVARSRAFSIMLPLTPILQKVVKLSCSRLELPLGKFATLAVKLSMEAVQLGETKLTKVEAMALVQILVCGGEPQSIWSL